MTIDDVRARYPALAGAIYFYDPGQSVTLEILTPAGESFSFTAPTVAECLAKAFPELTTPEPTEPEPVLSREATMRVMASLAAAISLLERSPKKAAASNKMFDQMLDDYRKALDAARAELNEPAEPEPEAPAASVFD